MDWSDETKKKDINSFEIYIAKEYVDIQLENWYVRKTLQLQNLLKCVSKLKETQNKLMYRLIFLDS